MLLFSCFVAPACGLQRPLLYEFNAYAVWLSLTTCQKLCGCFLAGARGRQIRSAAGAGGAVQELAQLSPGPAAIGNGLIRNAVHARG